MQTAIDPKEILRLYEALNERVLAKDSKGTLQIYDELLRLGQPLSEIMAHGLRALNDSPARGRDDAGEALAAEADAATIDEPAPAGARFQPLPGSNAGSVREPSDWAIAPAAFGEAPPIAGDTGNRLPLPGPATVAPGALAQPLPVAMARRSLIARLGLAACAVALLAGIGVLLMQPAAEEVVPNGPAREAPIGVRAETSSIAEAVARATGAEGSATVVGGASSTEPGSAPTPASGLAVTAPPPEPAPRAQTLPDAPDREMVATVPPGVTAPASEIAPEQPRLADAEIAALLARLNSPPGADAAAAAPAPAPKIPADHPRLAAGETAALLARGDSLLGVGDIASARLFYERASDGGDGRAALRLGATYDPGFLARVRLPHPQGDVAQALSWYRRARDLGESEAERWIRALETRSGR